MGLIEDLQRRIIIPEVKITKYSNGTFWIFIPERFKELIPKVAIAKLYIVNDKEEYLEVGEVHIVKANNKNKAVRLPKRLAYKWEELYSKKIQLILVLEKSF
ncbi:hypothetical protein [Saccharolobus caldissimus]|uniref:DUF1905 domain-containing protein n=1 Tax=Saccharolobus caldissimus TaxID=1702097 RepID=A0AAQ4CMH0_9CREN|nr:hypothetical protein [Saccharolobus caldissimus]BDB97001.1 hypothetical protein SACC_00180 [Saccharolobus caldissimus]